MYIHTDIIVTARLVLGLLKTKYKQGEVQHQVNTVHCTDSVYDPLNQGHNVKGKVYSLTS